MRETTSITTSSIAPEEFQKNVSIINKNSSEVEESSTEAAQLIELAEHYSRVLAESFYLENVRGNVFNFESYVNKAHSGLLDFLKSKSFIREDENVLLRGLYHGHVPDNAPFKPPISHQRDKVDSIKVKNSATTISRPLSESASILPHYTSLLPPVVSTTPISTSLTTTTTNSATAAANMRKFSEKMKAEASVVQRISELQKEGLWYDKRLPRIHEAARNKTHWDYLLEEMVWLAADFASERKWKRAASRRCAKMVDKYFSDRKAEQKRAEKEEEIKVRRIASRIAKEINNFWSNVQKLVEYKEQSRIEELRKKALDQQLSYIVDQTEKYSSMLAESFISDNNNSFVVESTIDGADDSSTIDPNLTSTATSLNLSDDEFEPDFESGEDDEETIAKAEEDANDVNTEIEALQRESVMSLDDFLDELPAGYIEECKARYNVTEESEDAGTSKKEDDHDAPTVDVSDIPAEQPEEQKNTEIVTSTADNAGTIVDDTSVIESETTEIEKDSSAISTSTKESPGEEQLQTKTVPNEEAMDTGPTTQESDLESGTEETEDEDDDDDDDEGGSDDSTEITDRDSDFDTLTEDELEPDEDEEQTVGLASLLQTFAPERAGEDHEDDPLNSVAAMAESFQPKGYTLSSTTVVTKVPFLLKHELREYQHIGLDWLVTMHEKKLNGILADEMGLGKTIQTIALLAHLACEKGNWGPHLIVVPTSVMLNWEMEFKKWCPGFKILTYYGSIKERRLKRTGWTKNNAFHVCITSYKLVIQDHASFRRKRWKYLILDEAQNIKNFKSQRWQLLLNFATHRRLLLTGTPLQNNLMELWSLMHFLMPNVFQSHREFREWFSNPMSGMVEGNSEYNENIIRRLHKVLRPFILRRLKLDVEKQLPQKYEHVVMCRLSKRQRYLYEEFMSRSRTKETLATGNLLSVINVLMQLRKVCNHPNLFESRPVISPFQSDGLSFPIPSIVWNMFALLELEKLTRAVTSMSSADLYFSKSEAQRIWNLRPQGVEPLNGLSSSPSRLKRKRDDDSGETVMETDVVDADITEYDYILQTTVVSTLPDGSIRCAPKRKRFLKWCADDLAAPVPRTNAPIPFFLMNVDPTPYLEDNNFVDVVGAGAPKPSGLQLSNDRNSNGRIEIVTKGAPTSLDMADQFSRHIEASGVTPKSGGRITKRNTEANQLSTTTTINDSVLKSSRKENLQDESEDDLDEEEQADDDEEEESFEEEDSDVSIEYEHVTPTGRKRKKKTSLIISRESKRLKTDQTKQEDGSVDENSIGENSEAISKDEYESSCSDDDTLVKRNKIRFTPAQSIKGLLWARSVGLNPAEFQEADVQLRSIQDRRALIERLQCINDRRCEIIPVMGADTLEQCKVIGQLPRMRVYGTRVRHLGLNYKGHSTRRDYNNHGYFNRGYEEVCSVSTLKNSQSSTRLRNHPLVIWRHTKALIFLIKTLEEVLEEYTPTLKRFMLYVPAVATPVLSPRVFRPNPSEYLKQINMEQELKEVLRKPTEIFHPIISSMTTQFPDPRLIQYDCGKLQVLDGLLRRLKAGNHRILIFTQMARMLDVLEVFLNYHGYIYLRLDGATKIDQRQLLMEKFNTDTRIFCFILSTRSGGIGVNLTGADSVIFYDSDWNPTMDAQAQDRCHRIGQTRDVHIYRLVSEKTVEENILKKSNQKRLLGELAINDGNFTTAFFAKQSIKDLFEVRTDKPEALKRLEASVEIVEAEKTPEDQESIPEKSVSPPPPSPTPCIAPELVADDTSKPPEVEKSQIQLFETALAAAEDEMDVQATRTVKAEAAAELAEFDESIPLDELGDGQDMVESSMVDIEMQSVMAELNAVERYALKFMERTIDDWSTETVAQAQKEMEQQKREWELEQMRKLESQMKASPELSDEEDNLLTYASSDAQNQVKNKLHSKGKVLPNSVSPRRPVGRPRKNRLSRNVSEDLRTPQVRKQEGGNNNKVCVPVKAAKAKVNDEDIVPPSPNDFIVTRNSLKKINDGSPSSACGSSRRDSKSSYGLRCVVQPKQKYSPTFISRTKRLRNDSESSDSANVGIIMTPTRKAKSYLIENNPSKSDSQLSTGTINSVLVSSTKTVVNSSPVISNGEGVPTAKRGRGRPRKIPHTTSPDYD